MLKRVSSAKFCETIVRVRAISPLFAENLHQYTLEEYGTMRCYMELDAGFAIKADGELVNVFNATPYHGLGKVLVRQAVRLGGQHLDCFDGYLPMFYSGCGFAEYKREPNWTAGQPDVVYMRYGY